jgi:hypothetical protein
MVSSLRGIITRKLHNQLSPGNISVHGCKFIKLTNLLLRLHLAIKHCGDDQTEIKHKLCVVIGTGVKM